MTDTKFESRQLKRFHKIKINGKYSSRIELTCFISNSCSFTFSFRDFRNTSGGSKPFTSLQFTGKAGRH